MATYALTGTQRAAHTKTQTASAVDRVTIAKTNIDQIEIISDATADLFVRVDGVDPAVDGAFAYKIPAGTGPVVRTIDVPSSDAGADVRLIARGASTPVWSVTALDSAT